MARSSTSGQGRKKGVPNKITRPIRELAANFSEGAIATLVKIAADQQAPHAARVAACRELLDRAHGRPSTCVASPVPTNGTLAEQGEATIRAALDGSLPLEHLNLLMGALANQAKLVEQSEIVERLEAVKQWLQDNSVKS